MAYKLNSRCGCCGAFNADFLLYTYNFSAPGTDLDTRTSITSPFVGPSMGYCQPSTPNPYLKWGGDNQGVGVEACYADVAQVKADYPSATYLDVLLHAVWYGTATAVPTVMTIKAYKGGIMVPSGFTFVNVGGVQTAILNFPKVITADTTDCVLGDLYGTAHYDFITGILTVI